MEEPSIKCYIHNGTPNYKIHTLVKKCDDPKSLLLDDQSNEYCVIQDYIREYALERAKQQIGRRPLGIFTHPEEIGEELFRLFDEYVEKNIKDNLFYEEIEEPRFWTIKREKIDLPDKLYFFNRDAEGHGIETGDVIIRMVREFMQRGFWHFGFKNSSRYIVDVQDFPTMVTDEYNRPCWIDSVNMKCEPVLWFGLEAQNPIGIWTIGCNSDENGWKSFWFNSFWQMDWNALFGGFDDYYTVWMFAECGMEEPSEDFFRVRSECPIILSGEDSDADLQTKIVEFAKSLYKNGKYARLDNIFSTKMSDIKTESLRNAVYKYGFDYGASFYADYPDDVKVILNNEAEYGILDIYDSGPEVIGSGMLSEIEANDYFNKDLFSQDEYALDFYDLLEKYLDYEDLSEAFDNGMTDAIKEKYGVEGFKELYSEF